jgi:DNA polymerase-3 subunit gamma/tau
MRPEQVENQLVKIVGNEGIEFDQIALNAIAKAADGSMRDGLSLLDQAIAQGAGSVRVLDVESMLGTLSQAHSEGIVKSLITDDVDQLLNIVVDMADHAVDFSMAIDDLLMQLYYISLAQLVPAALQSVDTNHGFVTEMAEQIEPELVQLYYQIGLLSKRDLNLAPSLRVGFEMALLRMLAFEPVSNSEYPIQDPAPVPVVTASTSPNMTAGQKHHESAVVEQAPRSLRDALNPVTTSESPQAASAVSPTQRSVEPSVTSAVPSEPVSEPAIRAATPEPPARSIQAVTLAGNNEWGELVESTQLVGLSKQLAMHCACERLSEDVVLLSLAAKHEHLFKPDRVNDIQQELQRVIGPNVVLKLEIQESDKETPTECRQRLGVEQLEQTKENLSNDPNVKALMSEFGASINEQSIKPAE